MASDGSILEGFTTEAEFAHANNVHLRTIKRYRDEKDGLPFLIWGGRVYIPTEHARAWLMKRIRRPNPTAKKLAAA
jgi:hypothetical protein